MSQLVSRSSGPQAFLGSTSGHQHGSHDFMSLPAPQSPPGAHISRPSSLVSSVSTSVSPSGGGPQAAISSLPTSEQLTLKHLSILPQALPISMFPVACCHTVSCWVSSGVCAYLLSRCTSVQVTLHSEDQSPHHGLGSTKPCLPVTLPLPHQPRAPPSCFSLFPMPFHGAALTFSPVLFTRRPLPRPPGQLSLHTPCPSMSHTTRYCFSYWQL